MQIITRWKRLKLSTRSYGDVAWKYLLSVPCRVESTIRIPATAYCLQYTRSLVEFLLPGCAGCSGCWRRSTFGGRVGCWILDVGWFWLWCATRGRGFIDRVGGDGDHPLLPHRTPPSLAHQHSRFNPRPRHAGCYVSLRFVSLRFAVLDFTLGVLLYFFSTNCNHCLKQLPPFSFNFSKNIRNIETLLIALYYRYFILNFQII